MSAGQIWGGRALIILAEQDLKAILVGAAMIGTCRDVLVVVNPRCLAILVLGRPGRLELGLHNPGIKARLGTESPDQVLVRRLSVGLFNPHVALVGLWVWLRRHQFRGLVIVPRTLQAHGLASKA